jgi:hypothetical protein
METLNLTLKPYICLNSQNLVPHFLSFSSMTHTSKG